MHNLVKESADSSAIFSASRSALFCQPIRLFLSADQPSVHVSRQLLGEIGQQNVAAGPVNAGVRLADLVTAKGYADCVAFMGEDSVSVVVSAEGGLGAEDVAKISEIVLTETDYTADQIKILEAN